ncbi:MAG TPA: SigE family RNA polymerase sigma factor [Streptosporangiaceae bacterium]|nr:SigE family RNA polymerase sigma factor [Streptosporangiaceae bacterium]
MATRSAGRSGRHALPDTEANEAVAGLYCAQYEGLVRLSVLLAGDLATAEEIVQAAFAEMHRAWRGLRSEQRALQYLRRHVLAGARRYRAANPGPDRAAWLADDPVLASLKRLTGRQLEALVLRHYAQLPGIEIAEAMGTWPRLVEMHLRHGLAALDTAAAGGNPPEGPRAVGPDAGEPG